MKNQLNGMGSVSNNIPQLARKIEQYLKDNPDAVIKRKVLKTTKKNRNGSKGKN